ncbi:putative transcription factor B3-Domain family [Helianthus annuus]|nr:putative transcription factor B3-Domain family [Helianthus annuus]
MVKGLTDTAYWMGFPLWFGKLFLPKADSEMVIEDGYMEIHHVKYNAEKSGMSAGWKKFAVGHNFLDGDVLVFHLVEPYKLKVLFFYGCVHMMNINNTGSYLFPTSVRVLLLNPFFSLNLTRISSISTTAVLNSELNNFLQMMHQIISILHTQFCSVAK